jgi:hypothetical protein
MTREFSDGSTSELRWFKSSHSGSNNNDCIEVAVAPGAVHVRDSKDVQGPQLALTATAWSDFVAYTAAG